VSTPPRNKRPSRLLPHALQLRIESGQCVAFVGAGFSMACGMPGWFDLLQGLLSDARAASSNEDNEKSFQHCEWFLKHGNLPMAANVLRDAASQGDLLNALRARFGRSVLDNAHRPERKRMETRMRNLAHAPWRGIVTTNYDHLIEDALTAARRSVVVSPAGESTLSSQVGKNASGLFFTKLHGSTESGEVILSTEEYDRVYLMQHHVRNFLNALMQHYCLVFIGSSLEDEISRIRRTLWVDSNEQIPLAYALLPASDENLARRSWLRKFVGVESILYPTDKGHRGMDTFLSLVGKLESDADHENLNSIARFKRLSVDQRMVQIGKANRELVDLVRNHTRGRLANFELVDEKFKGGGSVEAMSPGERYYRMAFLVAIGLIREIEDGSENRIYLVNKRLL